MGQKTTKEFVNKLFSNHEKTIALANIKSNFPQIIDAVNKQEK